MGIPRFLGSVFLIAALTTPRMDKAQAQIVPTDAGCVIGKREAVCNWIAFRAALNEAHVIAVEYGPMDQATETRLKELVKRLGKKLATPEIPDGLTFAVVQPDTTGIEIGPEDQELVEFRVYDGPSSHGRLVWVESFRGPADRPWSMSVQAVLQQFEVRLTNLGGR